MIAMRACVTYQACGDCSVPERARPHFEKHISALSILTHHLNPPALDPSSGLLARFKQRNLALWERLGDEVGTRKAANPTAENSNALRIRRLVATLCDEG